MPELLITRMPRTFSPSAVTPSLRSVRPSLVDPRFTGDPWVVAQEDGSASVRLDNYRLARIQSSPLDLPSLNQLLLQLRLWQARRRMARRHRSRPVRA